MLTDPRDCGPSPGPVCHPTPPSPPPPPCIPHPCKPICFFPGTRVESAEGLVCVEDLKPGDLVVVEDGDATALRPVRWIGHNPVSLTFADPLRALPIRIRAGALGENLPCRDLLVSPGHAIRIGDVLVSAGALVNGSTIVREHDVPAEFTYYHIELDTHSLLLAEGVPAESFLDGVEITAFANFEDRVPSEIVEELPYPRIKAQRQLPRAIREWLAARSAMIEPVAAAA